MEIASANDTEMQTVLQHAYEKKLLRGHKLIAARRLVEQRRRRGKGLKNSPKQSVKQRARPLSSSALIRAFQQDVDRKRILIRKAETTRNHLVFVTEAMRNLFRDENFLTLLRAEDLDSVPSNLATRIQAQG
jgi:ParB family chromosome partitioning protein